MPIRWNAPLPSEVDQTSPSKGWTNFFVALAFIILCSAGIVLFEERRINARDATIARLEARIDELQNPELQKGIIGIDCDKGPSVTKFVDDAGLTITIPCDYDLQKNVSEPNRRGSFVSFDFKPRVLTTPYLTEMQLFSLKSITDFNAACKRGEACFQGFYPTVDSYQQEKRALQAGTNLSEKQAVEFNGRDFLVASYPCEGDACFIREYTTMMGDIKIDMWAILTSDADIPAADALTAKVVLSLEKPDSAATAQ